MAGKAKKLVQLNFSALCGTGNSPPIIKSGPQSLVVTEIKDLAPAENTLIHKGSGAIKFTDSNVSDVHKASFAALGSGYIGSFSLGKVDQAKDSVPWTFKVADSVIDHLQAGETIIQKYKVVINDGHGGKAVQTVTVKIVGTNDAPIITSPTQQATVTELTPNDPGENTITHARNGAVTFHDVDTLDTHTATVVPQGGGYLGTFSIGALNQVGDSIPWTFTVPDSVLNSLGAGQTLTQKYNVTVNDGHGGTATQTVTLTIIGTNDPLEIGRLAIESPDNTLNEANLAGGSAPVSGALTQMGQFHIAAGDGVAGLTVGGVPVIVNGVPTHVGVPIPTAYGTVTITSINLGTGIVTYSYTLSKNTIDHHVQGTDTVNDLIKLVLTDGNGDTVQANINVQIVDDVPLAVNDDAGTIPPGAPFPFNVLSNDKTGADGPVTVVDAHLTTGSGSVAILPNGTLLFTPQPGFSGPVTISYTIHDADGDASTAVLSLNVSPTPDVLIGTAESLVVDEDGLQFANNDLSTARGDETPGTNSLTQSGSVNVDFGANVPVNVLTAIQLLDTGALDGQLHTLDGQSVFFDLVAGDLVGAVNGGATEVIRVHIVSATPGLGGNVTYTYSTTLSEPVQHAPGSVENNALLTGITFEVTGGTGAHAQGTFGVTIVDDVPDVTVSVNVEAAAALDETSVASTPDTLGVANIGDDPDVAGTGAIATASTAGSAVNVTALFGADGMAAANAKVYALSVTSPASGLFVTDGSAITLTLEGGKAVGRVSGGAFGGQAAFAISIDTATGVVSVEQYLSLKHPDANDSNDTVQLANDSVAVSVTITDGDGDTATAAADISAQISFTDDGPSLDIYANEETAYLDEGPSFVQPATLGVANIGDDPDVAGSGTIAVYTTSGAPVDVATVFGADGPALHNELVFALEASTPDSGLKVTDGAPITLVEEGGVIVGRVASGGYAGLAAFAIAIDPVTGQLSIEQYLSINHPEATDANDTVTLATGALTIKVTATDGDGDSISKTADISAQITFADDGPYLGPFTPGTIPIQVGTVNGFFGLAPGADGFDHFTITGPDLPGIHYTSSTLADGTRLLAETSTGTDVFALNVHSDGTYTFELIAPQSAHCHNVTWTEVDDDNDDEEDADGNDYAEVSHGSSSYEFSSNEDMRNPSSHGHFGEHSDHIDNAPDHFQIEFHDSCEDGDSDENSNAACMDNVSFGTHGTGWVTWVAHDTGHGTSESGHATIYNGHLEIDPTICFNQLDVSWEDGSFGIDDMEAGEHELPQDLNLAFQIALTDGDGDTTAAQTLNIHEVGAQAYGYLQLMGFAGVANDVIASSTMPDSINGGLGFDMADYTDSLAAISINLDDSGNSAGAPVPFSNPPDGTIGGGDAAGDTLTSIDGIIGGQGNDILVGNSAANWLFGSGGGDTLNGEDGDDTIGGGLGADTLTGGGGADIFVYSSLADSPTPAGADTIMDFASGTGELIDLHLIDASSALPGNQEFIFIDAATAATAANSISWNQNGGDTFIHADVNGDMVADLVIRLAGLHTLTSADFVV